MRTPRIISLFTLLMISALLAQPSWGAPSLTVGSNSGTPGQSVTVPVSFVNDGSVVSLQFDVQYDMSQLILSTPTGGATGLSSAPILAGQRFVIAPSSDNAALGSGQIVTLPFTIKSSATADTKTLTLSNVVMSNSAATAIAPITLSNGQIAVNNDVNQTVVADGTSSSLAIPNINQNARLTFSGTAGLVLNLNLSSLVFTPNGAASCSAIVTIYNPDGSVLTSTTLSASGLVNVPILPTTGTYAIYIDPQTTCTLTANVSVNPLAGQLTAGGSSVTATNPSAGQAMRFRFDATVGQYISLGVTGVSTTPANAGTVTFRIIKPDTTTVLVTGSVSNSGGTTIDTTPLAASGAYYVEMAPPTGATATATLTLSTDVNGTVATDGTVFPLSLTRVGQNARLTFSGTAGQVLGLSFGSAAFTANGYTSTCGMAVKVYKPDGTLMTVNGSTSTTLYSTTTTFSLDMSSLPATGSYTLNVDPVSTCTVTTNVSLNPAIGTLAVNGASVVATSPSAGQAVRYSFSGTAGQYISLGVTGVSTTPANAGTVSFYIVKPDGTYLVGGSVSNSGVTTVDTPALATTGTYTVEMIPPGNATATATLTLSADVNGTVATDGTVFPLSLTRVGQNARLTFSGTAGQVLGLSFGSTAFTANGYTSTCGMAVKVYKPDGTLMTVNGSTSTTLYSTTTTFSLDMSSLPATGSYTLNVDPVSICTVTTNVSLNPAIGTLAVNGASVTATSPSAGQAIRYSFSGTAGQYISLGVTGVSTTPANAGTVSFYIVKPDGTYLVGGSVSNSGVTTVDTPALATTGTYTVEMIPPGNATATATLTLSADVNGTVATDGTVFPLSLTRVGQNARLTFSGTAGQVLGLSFGSTAFTANGYTSTCGMAVKVYKPDGTLMTVNGSTSTTLYSTTTTFSLDMSSLPATGSYTLNVDPVSICTVTTNVSLNPAIGTLAVNGTSVVATSPSAGQAVRYSFSGTAGQYISLGVTDVSTTPANAGTVSFYIVKPDGTYLVGGSLINSGVTTVDTAALATTGTYTVEVIPPSGATATATLTLSADVNGTVATDGTVFPLSLTRVGQNARLSFSGTSGEVLHLAFNSLAFTANGYASTCYASVYVYKPDGTTLTSSTQYAPGSSVTLPSLTATGTHTIFVNPYSTCTLTGNMTLSP